MHPKNSAIETMKSEHRRIEAVLGALEVYAAQLVDSPAPNRGDLSKFVRFLQEYADALHHAKEEDILFVAMTDAGFPRNTGPIAVMLHEHETGRGLVNIFVECLATEVWSGEVCRRIQAAAKEFSILLCSHIQKEDRVLYEMARTKLPAESMERIDLACAERDAQSAEAAVVLIAIADELVSRYSDGGAHELR